MLLSLISNSFRDLPSFLYRKVIPCSLWSISLWLFAYYVVSSVIFGTSHWAGLIFIPLLNFLLRIFTNLVAAPHRSIHCNGRQSAGGLRLRQRWEGPQQLRWVCQWISRFRLPYRWRDPWIGPYIHQYLSGRQYQDQILRRLAQVLVAHVWGARYCAIFRCSRGFGPR